MIYFIEAENGPIKIGYSSVVERRFIAIKVMSPQRLRIIAVLEGDKAMERELHQTFSMDHLWGEWFKPENIISYLRVCIGKWVGGYERFDTFYDKNRPPIKPRAKGRDMTKPRRRRKSLKTDPDTSAAIIVEKFGGLTPMSEKTGIPIGTIYGWLIRGRIPMPQVPVLMGHAERLKVKIKPTDWLPQPEKTATEVESE